MELTKIVFGEYQGQGVFDRKRGDNYFDRQALLVLGHGDKKEIMENFVAFEWGVDGNFFYQVAMEIFVRMGVVGRPVAAGLKIGQDKGAG